MVELAISINVVAFIASIILLAKGIWEKKISDYASGATFAVITLWCIINSVYKLLN